MFNLLKNGRIQTPSSANPIWQSPLLRFTGGVTCHGKHFGLDINLDAFYFVDFNVVVVSGLKMDAVVANVSAHTFDIEVSLSQQLGAENLPFPGN